MEDRVQNPFRDPFWQRFVERLKRAYVATLEVAHLKAQAQKVRGTLKDRDVFDKRASRSLTFSAGTGLLYK